MLIDEALDLLGMERPTRPRNKIECPHHEERTPSLHLYEDDWYCFSCGANGDAFGLIAAIDGRDVADVLKEYGDGNYETTRQRAANKAKRRQEIWNAWYEWLDVYVTQLYHTLNDLPSGMKTEKVSNIFADADHIKATLPRDNPEPEELEAKLHEATDYLNDRLQLEIDLRNDMRTHAGVSPVVDELPQAELRSPIPEAGRRKRISVRGGSPSRQYGSVRVAASVSLNEGDDG